MSGFHGLRLLPKRGDQLEDDFSQKSGKPNRTQMLPLPLCYVRNGGRTGSQRVEWSTQRWEKSSLLAIHSFYLKWKFAQAEQDFFIMAVLLIQRAGPAKCSSSQQRLETAINKMALVFSLHYSLSSLYVFKHHQFLKEYERPLYLLREPKHRTSLFYFIDLDMEFIHRGNWKLYIH